MQMFQYKILHRILATKKTIYVQLRIALCAVTVGSKKNLLNTYFVNVIWLEVTDWLKNTQFTRLFIYSVHRVWFHYAIYKNAVLFFCTLALSAAATVADIKIRYEAKTSQFAIFGTRVICVFYST